MRLFFIITSFLFLSNFSFAQSSNHNPLQEAGYKGKMYAYWGWNVSWYTKSDITFKGDHYNFELKDVVGKDRQTSFALDPYFNPGRATIPQYNFRLGYYFKDNWDISFGIDHMKYVMQQDQEVAISGFINDTQTTYDGSYDNTPIVLTEDFLQFEHTDGLNYANIEIRKSGDLFNFNKIDIRHTLGAGAGVLVPKTNTTLLNKERYDEFHFSGYGLGLMAGVNVTFFDKFFVQSEVKGGFINMPNIRTTQFSADSAEQHFFFGQLNILFGAYINLNAKK